MSEQTFEVIVIGSGIGGMCAAALLARQGYRVLVVESLPRLGGRCSTLVYRGFRCPTGAIGIEIGGVIQDVFRAVGSELDVRPAGPPHYIIDGKICHVPEKGGFRSLISAATDDRAEVERVLGAISEALRSTESLRPLTLKEWISQHTSNESVFGIFHAMVSATMAATLDEVSAHEYFVYLKKLKGFRDWGFCPQGSIALPEALARVVLSWGGQVWTRSLATRILSENGVAQGVVIEKDGEEIRVPSSVVISNCGPKKTAQMAGPDNMGAAYMRAMERTLRPAALLIIQIASDVPLLETSYLLVTKSRRINTVIQPTTVCPELAPPGKHLILAGGGPPTSTGPMNWQEEITFCMEDLRDLFPGFSENTEVLLTGVFHGDLPGMHSLPGRDMPWETPITNLYNVGDGVKESGLVCLPAAANSGLLVAKDVQTRLAARG
ncbi:MAG: NAD(P)/FAD-dependent oxidoreductase [Desulfomonile tiedjei]|uniref:NAD(P)/FAD-dependent oxidoreductase n=1 Tax=Desulfomonile tiedjei TaxID=2358 RepID=A0A9D6VAL5_9BACT|nr:NAD(P)/FAD-dependent oxidoreductase [Desulfomonile tiedjei]